MISDKRIRHARYLLIAAGICVTFACSKKTVDSSGGNDTGVAGSTSNLAKSNWYTANLLQVLTSQKIQLAYVLVWANTKNNFYTPYKGHPAVPDLINFKNNGYVLFADKMPAMYTIK